MDASKRAPIGVELVRRGIVTEEQINTAMEYQKSHRKMKLGEIIKEITDCNPKILIDSIADILGEKGMLLTSNDIDINIEEYISLDTIKSCNAIPFAREQGKVKVCFADTANKSNVDKIRLLLLNKGLVMDKYITFESNINSIIRILEGKVEEGINVNSDMIKLIDSIIKTGMSKRASDIHF